MQKQTAIGPLVKIIVCTCVCLSVCLSVDRRWVPLSKLIRACQKQALLGKAAPGQVAFLVQMSSEPNANGRSETQSAASSGVVVA